MDKISDNDSEYKLHYVEAHKGKPEKKKITFDAGDRADSNRVTKDLVRVMTTLKVQSR